jgi:sulfatase modifying factor 1
VRLAAPFLARIDEQLRTNEANAAETILAELVAAVPAADVRDARSKIENLRRRIDDGRTRTAGTLNAHPLDQLNYVWIPAGTFQMGCSTADRECSAAENPPHLVRLTSGFWLGQTEVTNEAYAKFITATSKPRTRSVAASGREPVDSITWSEAQDFCKWVGGSLPTEAEWEYAARAGAPTSRYGELRDIAWFKDNSGNRAHDVGQKRSNAWGAQDMLGNLWEWVGDWYAPDYYRPATVSDPTGPASGTQRVVRGGSWDNATGLLRVSLRLGNDPGARSPNNGFRCALKALP